MNEFQIGERGPAWIISNSSGQTSGTVAGNSVRVVGQSVCGRSVRGFGRALPELLDLGGGSSIKPFRCIRNSATRALMSFRPPSGLRQSKCSHTAREIASRVQPASRRAAIRAIQRISSALKSRPQYRSTSVFFMALAGRPCRPTEAASAETVNLLLSSKKNSGESDRNSEFETAELPTFVKLIENCWKTGRN